MARSLSGEWFLWYDFTPEDKLGVNANPALIPRADSTSYPGVNVSALPIGRFSGDLHWLVLGDH
ncbi:hypothetical protein BHS06_19295 [Myxococcus xanthus]|uniref:hypothetical protein n=1 Tax=Myxococcus xanthus TaxID=34 RepID=UPI0011299EE7|nr:hypothetical protein [Myxococcus xanthus]QDE90939.1 hypothetical protein BHS06_19295 [Myxococcus xanthus]